MTGPSALGPFERQQRALRRFFDHAGAALREGGMLVVVFGLLDYFLGSTRPDPAWPWQCSTVGAILWAIGVGIDLREP